MTTPLTKVWGLKLCDLAEKMTSRGRRIAARLLAEGHPRAAGYSLLREAGYVWSAECALTDDEGTALATACCSAPRGYKVVPFGDRFMVDSVAFERDATSPSVEHILCVTSSGNLARAGDSWKTEIMAVCAAWKSAAVMCARYQAQQRPYPCNDCNVMTTTDDPCFDLCARCEREYREGK